MGKAELILKTLSSPILHIGKYAIAFRCEIESSEESDASKKCPCLGLFCGMLSTRLIASCFAKSNCVWFVSIVLLRRAQHTIAEICQYHLCCRTFCIPLPFHILIILNLVLLPRVPISSFCQELSHGGLSSHIWQRCPAQSPSLRHIDPFWLCCCCCRKAFTRRERDGRRMRGLTFFVWLNLKEKKCLRMWKESETESYLQHTKYVGLNSDV